MSTTPSTTPSTTAANPTPPTPPTPPPAPPAPTPSAAVDQVKSDVSSDVAAVESTVHDLHQKARAEYDALAPEAQSRIHTLLNDLETMYNVSLGGIHTLFGPDGAISKLTGK